MLLTSPSYGDWPRLARMTSGSLAPIVVRPRSPVFTTVGTWVVRLCLPWLLLSLLMLDAALTAMGLPPGERSLPLRLTIVAIGALPVAIVLFSPLLVRLPGFDWLFTRPQPTAVLNPTDLTLLLPSGGERRYRWEDIASLKFKGRWNGGSELRSPDGELLADIPDEIVHPKPGWRSADTLAESVVQVRPDRFALAPDTPSLGRPASFDLRDRVGAGVDLVAWKRRRDAILVAVFAVLILVGVIGTLLLNR